MGISLKKVGLLSEGVQHFFLLMRGKGYPNTFFLGGDSLIFHSVTTQTQAEVTIYYHYIIFLLPFNGNGMYGQFASKLIESFIIFVL